MRKLIKDVMISTDKQLKQDEAKLIRIEKWLESNEETMLNAATISFESIDAHIKQFKTELMEELTKNLDAQNEILKAKSEEVTKIKTKIIQIEPQITLIQQDLRKLDDIDLKQQQLIEELQKQIQNIQNLKLNERDYLEFKFSIEEKLRTLNENYALQVDRMLNNENYVEKYIPIYTQRMITESLDSILKKKQRKKLLKFNEIKMPILLAPIFEDFGLPNLIQYQREFHEELMQGLISEQDKFVKNAMTNEKERSKAKWQIQSRMSNIPLSSMKQYIPIEGNVTEGMSPVQRNFSVQDEARTSQISHRKIFQSKYEMPKLQDYKGPYNLKLKQTEVQFQEKKEFLTEQQRREILLKEVYAEEGESNTEDGIEMDGEDLDDDEDQDSFDFEEQLKKEITDMTNEKLNNFEQRLNYLLREHNDSCKEEFKMYESHIKDQVLKMTEYVQEVHANHIAEINNIQKEKSEQILVNQLLVKKMAQVESQKKQQILLNEQFQILSAVAAALQVLQSQRQYVIQVSDLQGERYQMIRSDVVDDLRRIINLLQESIASINRIKEGETTKIIKKSIFQISKTRQPSPAQSTEELYQEQALESKLNNSILVQGTGAGVLGPINHSKIKKQVFKDMPKLNFNQTQSSGVVFKAKRQSQQQNKNSKLGMIVNSRLEDKDRYSQFHTLGGLTFQSTQRKSPFNKFDLEESSIQMPSINNSYQKNNSSIMVRDVQEQTNLQASFKLDETLPQINTAIRNKQTNTIDQ